MSRSAFVERYGGIYEHSPWVAEQVAALVDEAVDKDMLALLMADCVDNASRDMQLALIRAHPDLAPAVATELTRESTAEQASAGLDRCSQEEYERFNALNADYREKFGFPFVMAVREKTRAEILDAFEARLANDPDEEFETALAQIHEIARLRLAAMEDD